MKEKRVIGFLSIIFAVIMLSLCIMANDAQSAIPETINYQGYLTDNSGNPINATVSMTFRIYTVASGGTALWTETQSNVPVNEGIYNVILGSVASLGALPFDVPYFLGVTVGIDSEMTPRQALTSVAYALTADTALNVPSNVINSTMIQDGTISSADVNFNFAASTSKDGPATGLSCTGCVTQTLLGDSAVNSAKIQNGTILFGDIGGNGCTSNQIIKYSGSVWGCAADANTTYSAGNGITLDGTQIRVSMPLSLSGSASAAVLYGQNTNTADYSAGVGGVSSAPTGETSGVYGQSGSTSGSGVIGSAAAATGTTYGVYGQSDSTEGTGVYGHATAATGRTYGIRGRSSSTEGSGVYGDTTADTGETYGVFGGSRSTEGRGVYGIATAGTGTTYGIRGVSSSTEGSGVYGWATALTGTTHGVFGLAGSANGYGGYFQNVATGGVTLKAAGTGIIQSTAKSYVWISGNGARKFYDTDTTIINMTNFGGATVQSGAAAGNKNIILPITVTSPLYGQAVTIIAVDVYWKGETASDLISAVLMRRQTGVCTTNACYATIIFDQADYTCASGTYPEGCTLSLTPTGNNILTADSGILYLTIEFAFSSSTSNIWIGGVRLTLEHD